jgi:hypothetical protein
VPVKLGQRSIGFLQTGQVVPKQPTRAGFKSISAKIMEAAYIKSREASTAIRAISAARITPDRTFALRKAMKDAVPNC